MRARIQNLGKKEAIRAFGMIFACVFVVFNVSGTWAYFTNTDSDGNEVEAKITLPQLTVNYEGNSSSEESGGTNVNVENIEYDGVTIYFDNSNASYNNNLWEIPCINYYCDSRGTTWPGRRMKHSNVPAGGSIIDSSGANKDVEASKDYWVKYKIPKDDAIVNTFIDNNPKFILNNNGSPQKTAISIPKYAKEIYVYKDDTISTVYYSQKEIAEIEKNINDQYKENISKQYINVYYNNTSNWSDFNLYIYGYNNNEKKEPYGAYPGTKISKTYQENNITWLVEEVERSKLTDEFYIICSKDNTKVGDTNNGKNLENEIKINLKNSSGSNLRSVYIRSSGGNWKADIIESIYEDGSKITKN